MHPTRQSPPEPTVRDVLARLGVGEATRREQSFAVAEAAFNGRLRLAELRLMRAAGFLPFDVEND